MVSAAERWDAELAYLRQVTDELAATAGTAGDGGAATAGGEAARAAVLAANPRFAALTRVRWGAVGMGRRACTGQQAAPARGGHAGRRHLVRSPGTRALSWLAPSLILVSPYSLPQKYGELAPAAPNASAGSALGGSMAALTIVHGGKTVQKKLPGGWPGLGLRWWAACFFMATGSRCARRQDGAQEAAGWVLPSGLAARRRRTCCHGGEAAMVVRLPLPRHHPVRS